MDDVFGADVKYKGRPVKGYYFLSFTVIMIIILTIVVIIQMPSIKTKIIDTSDKEN